MRTESNNPTPKSEFLLDTAACDDHQKMVDSAMFRRSLDTAKAAYVRALCDVAPGDPSSERYQEASASMFNRIQGMNDFVALLLNLNVSPAKPTSALKGQNLEHKN